VSATKTSRNPIEAVRQIVGHAKRLARLEFELRTFGLKSKATRIGIGAALGLLALLLLPLVLVFALATVAAALATVFSVWLSILIVTGILVLLIALLAGTAVILVRKALKGGSDGE
jgi:Putative Actinobacterial Holin-X, holin superfamily III